MKKIILAILIFFAGVMHVFSQEKTKDTNRVSQYYIETDPTALFFNGFSLAFRRSSTFSKNLNLGIGIYKTDLPDFYIESVEGNIDKGWEAKNVGLDGFIDYHIFNPNKGFTVGLTLSIYKFSIERNEKSDSFNSLVETLRVGYLWRPIKKVEGFYLYPWIGLSTNQMISGNNEIDGEYFKTPTLNFVPSFQIGFSF